MDGVSEDESEETLVVLRPTPSQYAPLGVDPRVVIANLKDRSDKSWRCGIWEPFSEMLVVSPRKDMREEQDDSDLLRPASRHRRIIFASRYVVAHAE